ncbi:MAG: hypothetical protein HYZ26_11495 [Chloroflexi bacterium]|nr:hypothetical protein [Chloroflexota bacterium]
MDSDKPTLFSEMLQGLGVVSLLAAASMTLRNLGSGNYEASLYSQYPASFWILVSTSGLISILTVFLEIFYVHRGYQWVWGVVLLLALTAFMLLQPYLRDYAFHGQYDTVVHYSWSLEIVDYGTPAEEDFYPLAHLWASLLANATGITVQKAVLLLPVLMYVVGICNAFVLAQAIDDRPQIQGLIVLMLVLPVYSFFQSMFYPLQMGIYFLWLFLAFFIRTRKASRSIQDSLIFIVILFALPFIHPLAVLAALVAIVSYYATAALTGSERPDRQQTKSLFESFVVPFAMLFASWFTWFSNFRAFGISVNRIFQALVEELSGQSFASRYSDVVQGSNTLAELSRLAIFVHGPALIYLALALVATGIAWRRREYRAATGFLLLNIIVFTTVGALSLAIDLIAETPQRYLNYAVAVIPAFTAPILSNYVQNLVGTRKAAATGLLALALGAAFWLGVHNLFFSSRVRETNHQFSFSQLSGYEFLMAYAQGQAGNIFSPIRGAQSIFALGAYSDVIRSIRTTPSWRMAFAPAHFGYSGTEERPAEVWQNPAYLVITEFERNLFQLGPQLQLFTPADFIRLDEDQRWNKIYDSGDFQLRSWRELEGR